MKQLVMELRCASEPEGSDILIAVVVLSVGSYCVAQGAVLGHLAGAVGVYGDLIVGQTEGQVQHYDSVWRDGEADEQLLLDSFEETEGGQGEDNLVEGLRGSFIWVQSMWLREVLAMTIVWGPGRRHLGVIREEQHYGGLVDHQKQRGGQVPWQDTNCGLCGGQGQGGKLEISEGMSQLFSPPPM